MTLIQRYTVTGQSSAVENPSILSSRSKVHDGKPLQAVPWQKHSPMVPMSCHPCVANESKANYTTHAVVGSASQSL